MTDYRLCEVRNNSSIEYDQPFAFGVNIVVIRRVNNLRFNMYLSPFHSDNCCPHQQCCVDEYRFEQGRVDLYRKSRPRPALSSNTKGAPSDDIIHNTAHGSSVAHTTVRFGPFRKNGQAGEGRPYPAQRSVRSKSFAGAVSNKIIRYMNGSVLIMDIILTLS